MIEFIGEKKAKEKVPKQPEKARTTGSRSRRNVTVVPVKTYNADDVKRIRAGVKMSQSLFADYLGVSVKTVEAWEAGTNTPSGAASRLLMMMEMDDTLTQRYPFVVKLS